MYPLPDSAPSAPRNRGWWCVTADRNNGGTKEKKREEDDDHLAQRMGGTLSSNMIKCLIFENDEIIAILPRKQDDYEETSLVK